MRRKKQVWRPSSRTKEGGSRPVPRGGLDPKLSRDAAYVTGVSPGSDWRDARWLS